MQAGREGGRRANLCNMASAILRLEALLIPVAVSACRSATQGCRKAGRRAGHGHPPQNNTMAGQDAIVSHQLFWWCGVVVVFGVVVVP